MFENKNLKKFYRLSLIKITFWVLFFSVINLILSTIRDWAIIPCKKLIEDKLIWSFCPMDPLVIEKTLYFGAGWTDIIYVNIIWPLLFVVVFAIFLPYTLACAVVEGWKKYIGGNNRS